MTLSRYVLPACVISLAALAAGCQRHDIHTAAPAAQIQQQTLTTSVFNPGESAIFAVSSVLVEGQRDAVLIDAQFSAAEAQRLVNKIKASGKRLTTIYISHGDPDFYFGLDTLHAAFPDAKILATPQTIAHIQATKDEKLKIWGPQLGASAPKTLIVPRPLAGDTLELEGQQLKVIGLSGPTPDRTFVWIPSIRTVAGGVPVAWGEHLWMADTQTAQSHISWLATLAEIRARAPLTVVPGHFVGDMPRGLQAVDFTERYISAFDKESAKAKNAAALIEAMKKRYPSLGGESSLELSAKVAKGEMAWK